MSIEVFQPIRGDADGCPFIGGPLSITPKPHMLIIDEYPTVKAWDKHHFAKPGGDFTDIKRLPVFIS